MHFRGWLIGAVAHGYTPNLLSSFLKCPWRPLSAGSSPPRPFHMEEVAPTWKMSMVDDRLPRPRASLDLDQRQCRPDARPYRTRRRQTPGENRPDSESLANIHRLSRGRRHRSARIGRSRGTGIVSQALKKLANNFPDELVNASVQVTLLDPHPATQGLAQESIDGNIATICYVEFQSAV
jgi:hypothetical protein